MAELKNFLLRGCRGRIGDVVIYQCRGKTCIRRLPEMKPKRMAPGMVAQQERVAGVAALYRAMKAAGMVVVWERAAEGRGMSGYALLVKVNSQAFAGSGRVCDFGKLELTAGRLQLPDNLALARGEAGELVLTWGCGEEPFPVAGGGDCLVVVLLSHEEGFRIVVPEVGVWRREEGRAVVRLPEDLCDFQHLFCYFRSPKGTEVSRSRYFLIV